jgi:MinD superfamily P-loop ATPase
MKILGVNTKDYKTHYIVEISHDEVVKVMNKSAYGDNKLDELKPNTEFEIAAGYDFRGEIVRAVTSMEMAHKNFANASAVMTKFAALLPKEATNDHD